MKKNRTLDSDDIDKKKYFTIIPNFIIDQLETKELALYCHIKRRTGEKEDGKYFATIKTTANELGWGTDTVRKYLKNLVDDGYITKVGTKKSKTHPINVYSVDNIWSENNAFYKNKEVIRKIILNK